MTDQTKPVARPGETLVHLHFINPDTNDRSTWIGTSAHRALLRDADGRLNLEVMIDVDGEPAPAVTSKGDTWDLFADIAAITAWLDTSNPDTPHEDSMRVLKLVEEAGEAAAAYIGMVGQNPRKGVTHTRYDLLAELADVAVRALCAMQHFTRNAAATRGMLAAKVNGIVARAGIVAVAEQVPGQQETPAEATR